MSHMVGRPPTGSPWPDWMQPGFRSDAARIARALQCHRGRRVSRLTAPSAKNTTWSTGNAQVAVSAGYMQNEIGFGWANAVYLKMEEVVEQNAAASAN